MSLSRHHPQEKMAHPGSITHQTAFDLSELVDRRAESIKKSSDEGWLTGGGTGISSFQIPSLDSAHIELVHPGTICSDGKCGLNLKKLCDLVKEVLFDPIRIKPSKIQMSNTREYQLRFEPYENPDMNDLMQKLCKKLASIKSLTLSEPFHASFIRDVVFHSLEKQMRFLWDKNQIVQKLRCENPDGLILNKDLAAYKNAGTGGIYLFITRNRPLIYFNGKGDAYFVKWVQDGKQIDFANPYCEKPIKETLVKLNSKNFSTHLKSFQDLCKAYPS